MQAVILAAGRGTRMGMLTKETPKSMLLVSGKSILQWKLEALPEVVDEVIIVVGYLGNVIRTSIGASFRGKKISYVVQENPVGGTMDALRSAQSLLHGTFVVMNGDDIHDVKSIEACLSHSWALAVCKTETLGSASSVTVGDTGEILDIVEADHHDKGSGLAGVGLYVLDNRVFDAEPVVLQGRTETGLPQTMLAASRKYGIPITAVPVHMPLHLTNPEDVAKAEAVLARKK